MVAKGEEMKILVWSLSTLFILSPVFADVRTDSLKASCSIKLDGNDITGSEDIDSLESFNYKQSVNINSNTAENIDVLFARVIPFYNDFDKSQKYQTAIFRKDSDSINIDLKSKGIPNQIDKIKGRFKVNIRYKGENSEWSHNHPNDSGSHVDIKVTFRNQNIETNSSKENYAGLKVITLNSSGKGEAKINGKVPVFYKDYGRDGFVGGIVDIFSEPVSKSDKVEGKQEVHYSKVEVKCEFSKNKPESIVGIQRSFGNTDTTFEEQVDYEATSAIAD
jgi:hypothetical protein